MTTQWTKDSRKKVKGLARLPLSTWRWPLARLTALLLKSVDHLDRVLAGLLGSTYHQAGTLMTHWALRQAARSLTLTLASYLAEFVEVHL